jgi:hypothetical protein
MPKFKSINISLEFQKEGVVRSEHLSAILKNVLAVCVRPLVVNSGIL